MEYLHQLTFAFCAVSSYKTGVCSLFVLVYSIHQAMVSQHQTSTPTSTVATTSHFATISFRSSHSTPTTLSGPSLWSRKSTTYWIASQLATSTSKAEDIRQEALEFDTHRSILTHAIDVYLTSPTHGTYYQANRKRCKSLIWNLTPLNLRF